MQIVSRHSCFVCVQAWLCKTDSRLLWGSKKSEDSVALTVIACIVVQGFPSWKQAHVGMEASKTNQTRWEWHHNTFHTIPTSCAVLPPLTQIWFDKNTVCVCCVQWRVLGGSGVGSGGCVARFDVHGDCVIVSLPTMSSKNNWCVWGGGLN